MFVSGRAAALAATLALGLIGGPALVQEALAQEQPAATPAVVVSSGPPDAATFAKRSNLEHIALSPSGTYIASVLTDEKDSYIAISGLGGEGRKVTKLSEGVVYNISWVTDDRLVYSAGSNDVGVTYRYGGFAVNGLPRFFSINRDFTEAAVLFDKDKKIDKFNVFFDIAPTMIANDPDHILLPVWVGGDLDLLKVDIRTSAWTQIGQGSNATIGWMADREGRPVLRLDTNLRQTELRVMTPQAEANGKIRWKEAARWRRDRKTGKAREFQPLGPGPEPHLYYVLGRAPGADRIGVHLYDIKAEAFKEEVFVHPDVDVEMAFVDSVSGTYRGAAYWKDQLEIALVDMGQQKHINGLKTYFGEQSNLSLIDRSRDGTVWLLALDGPRDPGSFHVYDTKRTYTSPLGYMNAKLAKANMGEMQTVSYPARDGMAIRGYLTLPPGLAKGEVPPLIVYPHGGPEVRDTASYNPIVQFLATHGYAVFQPNFRGSSGYGLKFAKAGRRQFGRAMQTDIDDGVAYLASKGLVDTGRVCILGESYGGYAALMGAARSPDLYRCAVSVSGMSDLRAQILWDRKEEGADSEVYKYWVEQLGDPRKDRAEMDENSPVNLVNQIRAPILLLHGRKDDNVPIEQAEFMDKALREAGKPVRFVPIEEAGHGFEGDDMITYLNELEKFFGEHLPVKLPAKAN